MVKQDGWGAKTGKAIPKLLFSTTEINRPRLLGDIAYYNFVQRPMNKHEKERPTPNDFLAGWKVFAHVVRIIQPSHCLFIGVSAAKHFDLLMARQNLSFDKVSCAPKVAGVWPRVAKLEIAETTTKRVFVHHLSRCKSLSQWHHYLQTQHADLMSWLKAESYANSLNA